MMATISPLRMVRVIPRRACTFTRPVSYVLTTLIACMIGSSSPRARSASGARFSVTLMNRSYIRGPAPLRAHKAQCQPSPIYVGSNRPDAGARPLELQSGVLGVLQLSG